MEPTARLLLVCSSLVLGSHVKRTLDILGVAVTVEANVPVGPAELLDCLPSPQELRQYSLVLVDPELFAIGDSAFFDYYESLSGGEKVLLYLRRHSPHLPVIAISRWFGIGPELAAAVANVPFDAYIATDALSSVHFTAADWGRIVERATASRLAARGFMVDPDRTDLKDVFICHASEDRSEVVEPLVRALRTAAISYWYDQDEITWGDSIAGMINFGLNNCRYVIVVLSAHALKKTWPKMELAAALQLEVAHGSKRLLPLLVGPAEEAESLLNGLPLLRDRRHLRWYGGAQTVVNELYRILQRTPVRL